MRYRPLLALLLGGCAPPAREHAPLPRMADDLAAAFAQAPREEKLRVLIVAEPGVEVDERLVRASGGLGQGFATVPVRIAELTWEQAAQLAAEPGVWLAADRPLLSAKKDSGLTLTADPDLVRRSIGADLVHQGSGSSARDGTGIVIGIVDSGISAKEKDFPKDLLVASADFAGGGNKAASRDDYGHGTLVAGAISGTRTGARGVAPGARLLSARALDEEGVGTTADAIAAIDWLVDNAPATGLRVVHLSIGAAPHESFTQDPLALAVDAALDAGIVVVAAAGNFGYSDDLEVYGGILSPGTHPGVITVGALDPMGTARRSDDQVAPFSSRGPTLFDGLGKPDLVAPGVSLPLPARKGSVLWDDHPASRVGSWTGVELKNSDYALASGTSFAAPLVTGTVALVLEANPELTPAGVKAVLELTAARQLDPTGLATGAGALNALGAVRLAEALADPSLALPVPTDRLSGEDVSWGLTLYWDGYDTSDLDLSSWNVDGVLGVGDISGTGILWDGTVPRYTGLQLRGGDLLQHEQPWWEATGTWGSGILWDGSPGRTSSRTWTSDSTWQAALVWPDHLEQGVGGHALEPVPAAGLTAPVSGAADPLPPRPTFGSP